MKFLHFFWLVILVTPIYGQEDFLARQYFNDGEFEKATIYYENLVARIPRRSDYAENLVTCYQQLEQYDKAEEFLRKRLASIASYPTLYVDLGQNYRLQDSLSVAREYYEKAHETVLENPNFGYAIGFRFQRYTLLDDALRAFTKAMELDPQLNYGLQIARIYGEQGKIDQMFNAYLDIIDQPDSPKENTMQRIDYYLSEDAQAQNNQILRKILLQRAQRSPNTLWNELLSWLFVNQNQFYNAFTQEKAIYKRSVGTTLERMSTLGELALEKDAVEDANEIFEYILKNGTDPVILLNAQLNLIDIDLLELGQARIVKARKKFEELETLYGYQNETLQLQIAYANFLTFKDENPNKGQEVLKRTLELPLSRYSEGYVKLALGDILVYDRKFNEALILFSQIQKRLKNDVLGQEARFKVAQTSFYKSDFDWALTQLKVLRGSTSQLIANDAMQLSLLIADNTFEDSTQTALKKYARADLLAYQNKTDEAISSLETILKEHKGEQIEDEAMLKLGELFFSKKDYNQAEFNFRKVVEFYPQGILADDAHFALGELYRNQLNDPERAKTHYERIIYDFQDSYFFPQAQKQFRIMRGDIVN
ncbi:MAG: tetratricopeptide repeat protein [Eudoraea sp.]|nr:tetratricopeptide repeat protein [Eudoraea sp.]